MSEHIIDEASRAQISAATPNLSTWVSANAGSGKTRVLTNRVARLLLHGTAPQKILCLTYTKAAAAEMQNRLFESLGSWAMKQDGELRAELIKLGEDRGFLTKEKLREARTLFAAALETPGGLKIQTIHSFCDAMLRQFPLEAGLSPQFTMMDDANAQQMRFDIFEDMAAGPEASIVAGLAQHLTDLDATDLLLEISRNKESFLRAPKPTDFGITGNETTNRALDAILAIDAWPMLDNLCVLLDSGVDSNVADALLLRSAKEIGSDVAMLSAIQSVFLTKEKTLRKNYPKAAFLKVLNPQDQDTLEHLKESILEFTRIESAEKAYLKSQALFTFATPFLERYAERKLSHGLVDFDDLISKARMLLSTSETAQWILFRLDGGIDHILVDEAQDTSPDQWDVISKLAEEFFAGDTASTVDRTIFVVGDEKQSIYSFQGADPLEFDVRRGYFSGRLDAIKKRLFTQELRHSFRSATPILQLVDNVFDGTPVGEDKRELSHIAYFDQLPGRVDLWPFEEKSEKDDDPEWYKPVNMPAPNAPEIVLARKIAKWAAANIGVAPLPHKDGWRTMIAGDLLILVQKRGPLFRAIIAELKRMGLPLAGADRIKIANELAVKDILSMLRFASLPEDDLSLAEVLRSPLMGLSEGAVFSLAHERKGTLWQSFRTTQDDMPIARDLAWDVLNHADLMRPYELINLILTKHNGRRNLLSRLGPEAEDAIDELLNQALNYEQTEPPTLTGFLDWIDAGDIEIKRQLESGINQIRVMTIHGAKGLEAPVVILPDTADRISQDRNKMIDLGDGLQGWKVNKKFAPPEQLEKQDAKEAKDAFERRRLLYVALTRAEKWLIVCGAGTRKNKKPCWYNLIEAGINKSGVVDTPDGTGLRYRWNPQNTIETILANDAVVSVPHWMGQNAPQVIRDQRPISPSRLSGAKALQGEGMNPDAAKERGTLIHLLLEHLPGVIPTDRTQRALDLLETEGYKLTDIQFENVLNEALGVIDNPDLASIFVRDALVEVGITAPLPSHDMRPIDGIIDRLIVSDSIVKAIDFKSNTVVPTTPQQTPLGVLAQMGAYLIALEAIYPDHKIELSILWTRTALNMSIPHDLVRDAFQSATLLDPPALDT
jgi:ATP-dependent helicase/nuclease subunit A